MDFQEKWIIQTLDDILKSYLIVFKGSFHDRLPLIEFYYDNIYHSSIQKPS